MNFIRTILNWIQASRLPSQLYIFLPLVLGQAIGYQESEWNITNLIQLTLYGIFIQLFIIYANDYADQETDSLNETYTIFSGGSRVLVEGKIKPSHIRYASYFMALLSFLITLSLAYQGYLLSPIFWFLGILLLWMYSYPPFKLSYRGGGEFLQAIGLGIVLPFFGFYIATGTISSYPWEILTILLPTQIACAITTSLPDQISDRISLKKTFSVLYGNIYAKLIILALQCVALFFCFYLEFGIFYIAWFLVSISIIWLDGIPGTKRLNFFIFFQLFATLSIESQLILHYLI
ncbi:MAG: prenyltransferase [Leptospira sp.]|nr:prenyltransferase [Leptospira sp.]